MVESRDRPELEELEEHLGYSFVHRWLLEQALRHGSAAMAQLAGSYQRLEFLGDAVLGHAVAFLLYETYRTADEGVLTRMKSHLVKSSSLAAKARELELERFVVVGISERSTAGRSRRALLEDVLEAVIGAMVLDGGWDPTLSFVTRLFARDIDRLGRRDLDLTDPKSSLQEWAQARGKPLPSYREVAHNGPDHELLWAFEVTVDRRVLARGEGPSKRRAQQNAARAALERLERKEAPRRHDRSRDRALTEDELRAVPGLGPARLRRLLEAFSSPEGVRLASEEELTRVLGPSLGPRVYSRLHSLR